MICRLPGYSWRGREAHLEFLDAREGVPVYSPRISERVMLGEIN
jgi:hypothetical protein